jgi:CDP-6-deoxy-D-xylo-4-hexulose-3-dehydrase
MKYQLEIKSMIAKVMEENRNDLKSKQKYYYPLAEPTYDEEEVYEALHSMVTFKTTMWDKVRKFESEFGAKFGGEAIMVNSGSSADLIIAFALLKKSGGSLKAGDEILVPAVTWPTHLWSLLMAGFKVRLIDVSIDTLNFDIQKLESEIRPETKGIFIVHLLGNVGKLPELIEICKKNNIILLEDCCEALGSKYSEKFVGTFGLASSFSFFFSHHLVTMEGGMILTKDKDFAQRCRLLRSHGWGKNILDDNSSDGIDSRYRFVSWGFNVRPTELQAGFGIKQLEKIDEMNILRVGNAEKLTQAIFKHSKWLRTMKVEDNVSCNWFSFPVIVSDEAPFSVIDLMSYLDKVGFENRPIVAGNLARQPIMSNFPEIDFGNLEGSNYLHDRGLYIGIHPKQDDSRIDKLAFLIDNFCERFVR